MEFKDIVMQRYATKAFTDQKIPEEKVEELLDFIRFAPSALNLQPWRVKVIGDQKTRDQLAPAMFGQPQAVHCSHLLILCANTNIDDVIATADEVMKEAGFPDDRRAQMIGMANTVKTNFTAAWAQQQVYLAFANAINGAKALGFDSCPMTGFDPTQVSTILNLPLNLVPTAVVPIGYAADTPVPKARLSRKSLLV
jgi:nitroreductase / dihydropteridine reductase